MIGRQPAGLSGLTGQHCAICLFQVPSTSFLQY